MAYGTSSSAAARRRRNTTLMILAALFVFLYVVSTNNVLPSNARTERSTQSSRDDDVSLVRTPNEGEQPHAASPLSPQQLRDSVQLLAGMPKYAGAMLSEPSPMYRDTRTLIVVPGHGVFRGLNAEHWANESEWGLEGHFQGHDGFLIRAFSQHVKRSLVELKERGLEKSLVVFSGGQTRHGAGPRSEGLSYYVLAEQNKLFGVFSDSPAVVDEVLTTRMFAEEFARDSYENLLFSICRFREITGHYPTTLVVVNWAYKQERFLDLHRLALRWHLKDFVYIGIDMKDAAREMGQQLPDGFDRLSDANTIARTKTDLYLCKVNEKLRVERNPQRRVVPYVLSCPELRGLLTYCGPELFDEKRLPWGTTD